MNTKPWFVDQEGTIKRAVEDVDGNHAGYELLEGDYRRLAACAQACEGLTDAQLSAGLLVQHFEAFRTNLETAEKRCDALAEAAKLAAGELLEALCKVAVDMIRKDFKSESDRRKYVAAYVEAAIAKYKGGA